MDPIKLILNKRNFYTFFLLFLASSILLGNRIDSLKNIISELSQNEKEQKINEIIPELSQNEKMLFFNEIAKMYLFSQPDLSFNYAKKALNLAEKLKDN